MSDKGKQIKNSFIYLLPIIIRNFISFATIPIFTRILTIEDYGVFALAQIYATFLSGITNFGLTIAYERNFFQYRENKQQGELLYSTLLFVIISFTVYGVLTYLYKDYLSKLIIGSPEFSDILFWAYCSTVFMSLNIYFLTFFKNSEDAKGFFRYNFSEGILITSFSLFFVAYLNVGVIGLAWGGALASFLIFSLLIFKFYKLLPFSLSWTILKDSLKLSYPLTPRIFFGILGNQFDKYMIGLLNNTGGVGIYKIGQKISYYVFIYMTALGNVYNPRVYKIMFEKGKEGGGEIGKYLTSFVYLSISVALMVSLFSYEAIYILTPESYHGAVDIVIILSMFYGSLFFGTIPQLVFSKKTHITSLLSIVSIALNIGLNIPFIMKWGAVGAAWATLLSGIISGIIFYVVSQYYYKIVWEYMKIGMIYLLFFGSSIILILLRNAPIDYKLICLFKIIIVIAYIIFGNRLKIITKENYLFFKKMLFYKNGFFKRGSL